MLPILNSIQDLLKITLKAAPRPHDPMNGLMAYHRQYSKYLLDEGGYLIGLNLSHTGMTDAQWQQIIKMKGFDAYRIKALNLSDNDLTEFRLEEMRYLEHLDVEDNPLTFPDESVMKQGQAAVLRFLKQIEQQGEENIYEVKMLILGEGGSGKTTLWKKLQNMDYPVPSEEESTVGIEIKEGWSFPHRGQDNTPFLVNMWDFGGQEIQHMTHQFFLTRRAFYVVLSDGRRETGNFSYWFKIIHLLGCDPENQTQPMPVLVILNKNKVANVSAPYDPADTLRDFPDMEVIKYEVDFGKTDEILKALPKTIKELLCTRMEHLPLRIPKLWNEVREALYQLKEDKDYIQLDRFQMICREIGIEDEQQMRDLSQTLTELGVILHHQDDDRLNDVIVLRPSWAVNGVYEILKHKEVGENQGRFDKRLLKRIWEDLGYKASERRFLMDLMLKDSFEVCFAAEEQGKSIYIAPQLLPPKKPDGFSWEADVHALRYIFQYPFMPKGLIGRLIVRLHEKIKTQAGKKVLWKKGMLLQDSKNGSEALVEEVTDKETGGQLIRIAVNGKKAEDRRFLLREIRGQVERIHQRSFPNLKFQELVPCCCGECMASDAPHFFKREYLDRAEKKGISHVSCEKSFDSVSVRSLIEGVDGEDRMRTMASPDAKKLISEGRLKEALEVIDKACTGENEGFKDEVILLNNRLASLQKQSRLGMSSPEYMDNAKNTLSKDILGVCNQIYKSER